MQLTKTTVWSFRPQIVQIRAYADDVLITRLHNNGNRSAVPTYSSERPIQIARTNQAIGLNLRMLAGTGLVVSHMQKSVSVAR